MTTEIGFYHKCPEKCVFEIDRMLSKNLFSMYLLTYFFALNYTFLAVKIFFFGYTVNVDLTILYL